MKGFCCFYFHSIKKGIITYYLYFYCNYSPFKNGMTYETNKTIISLFYRNFKKLSKTIINKTIAFKLLKRIPTLLL